MPASSVTSSEPEWVVIAGDWFVDENWLIAPHHSASSSHVGREHFRIISRRGEVIKDLCGGGLIARVFYELRKYTLGDDKLTLREFREKGHDLSDHQATLINTKEFQLCGAGRWNDADSTALPHFVHANCTRAGTANRASFSLSMPLCQDEVDVKLINLARASEDAATIRCIRTFIRCGGAFSQISRIDWEPEPPPNERSHQTFRYPELENLRNQIGAVVIDDHLKGCVNKDLILLLRRYAKEDARWFVRSKDAAVADVSTWPDWMKAIDKPIELLVIGPETCCRDYALNGLLAESDRLAAHSFDILEMLMRRHGPEHASSGARNVVLTSDKLEVVGLFRDKELVIAKPPSGRREQHEKINWTTALFAGLSYELIVDAASTGDSVQEPEVLLKKSLQHAHNHSGVRFDVPPSASAIEDPQPVPWHKVKDEWHQAQEGLGLVDISGSKKKLEIWRAACDLPGYIACIKEKRESIRRIWRSIRRFGGNKRPRSSVSILLEADPGIGKTHLARTLANQIDCTFIAHDIAQMIHRDELLDLFDMIAAAQADKVDKPVFVFVDEINALLDDSPVYGAFLSPLEAGNYLRRGSRFQLQPCIWMFAGTPGSGCAMQPEDAREKRKDFESRLTMIEKVDYRSMCEKAGEGTRVADQARLEQAYMGALMINQSFSDVHKVDKDVLALFQALPPEDAPARQIRRLASSLENVQYGRVHKGNCTSQEWVQAIDTRIPAHQRDAWKNVNVPTVDYVEVDPKM